MDTVNRALRRVPTWAVYALGALPLVWLIWEAAANTLGPNPVEAIEHRLGLLGLQFLIASLCITPLRWAGLNLIRYRRALGLLAFGYVALHLLTWVVLDRALRWDEIIADLYKRPYIIIGMVGFLALLPLALTSNSRAIRAMGAAAWGRLHQLAYVAAVAGALHWVVLVKRWPPEPLIYAGIVAALLLARVIAKRGPGWLSLWISRPKAG